ncbi:MAG: redoxin domain-containing protein [Acidimicrobiales bacterium]
MANKKKSPNQGRNRSRTDNAEDQARRRDRSVRAQYFGLAALGIAVIGGLVVWAVLGSRSESGTTGATDWDLPAVANDPDGDGRLTISEFAGQPLVVNFYANWCVACDAELPHFSEVSAQTQGQVQFVGVHTQEDGGSLDLPDEHGVNWWPIARDINGTRSGGSGLYDSLARTPGMPITAFYSAEGELLQVTNALDGNSLRSFIEQFYGV